MGRAYKIGDVHYPGVTTILGLLSKDALIQWAANHACEYIEQAINGSGQHIDDRDILEIVRRARYEWRNTSRTARDIGSEVHHVIEDYIRLGRDVVQEMRPEVENGFLAFLDWEKSNGVKWLACEREVVSKRYGYAGTLDARLEFHAGDLKGRKFIIDFKSSKAIYDEHRTQIAAYKMALLETIPEAEDDGIGVLRLDKGTGVPELCDCSEDYDHEAEAFRRLVAYYYAAKPRRLKNNPFVIK